MSEIIHILAYQCVIIAMVSYAFWRWGGARFRKSSRVLTDIFALSGLTFLTAYYVIWKPWYLKLLWVLLSGITYYQYIQNWKNRRETPNDPT